jgi:hypothetical protein
MNTKNSIKLSSYLFPPNHRRYLNSLRVVFFRHHVCLLLVLKRHHKLFLIKFVLHKIIAMTATAIKKQVDNYLPLLSVKQQALILDMIKTFLNVDKDTKRITRKHYNKEINEAVARIEKGNSVSHKDALKELSQW